MEQVQLSLSDVQVANDTSNLSAICEENGSWRKFPLEVISELETSNSSLNNRMENTENEVDTLQSQVNQNITNVSNLSNTVSGHSTRISNLESKSHSTSDYIVDQGTSGVWTYRKWNSGIAELWGYHYVNTACNVGWGYMLETAGIALPNFPFTFKSTPYGFYSWNGGGGAAFVEQCAPTTTGAGGTWLARPGNTTAMTFSGNIYMYIMGRWK